MKLKLFASILVVSIAGFNSAFTNAVASNNEPGPCVIGRTAAPIGFWTWPADSQVNLYLRTPDFSQDYVPAVQVAVDNWDATAIENGSNVHFAFRGLTAETKTALGELTIIRGDVYDKKIKHLALLQAHSLRGNQLIDYALIVVDSHVRNPEVLTNVLSHELGHSLGLLDCYKCKALSTAMSLLKTANESNGIFGPTACDKAAVLLAYRELARNVKSAPADLKLIKLPADEGEEPEPDDTPVVRHP